MDTPPAPSLPMRRASTGPRRILVRRAAALLIVEPLAPSGRHRPLRARLDRLELFAALMLEHGCVAHVARMAYDRLYARRCLALAQCAPSPALRALARELLARL